MAFTGIEEGPFVEADVSNQLEIPETLEWGIFADQKEDLPEDADKQMDDIHDAVVAHFRDAMLKERDK